MAKRTTKEAAKQSKTAAPKVDVKTHLLNPTFKLAANGKVESITGTCTEPGCKNKRTIKPQDAFQVRRCTECQKTAFSQKLAEKRKAKRQAERIAKIPEAKGRRGGIEADQPREVRRTPTALRGGNPVHGAAPTREHKPREPAGTDSTAENRAARATDVVRFGGALENRRVPIRPNDCAVAIWLCDELQRNAPPESGRRISRFHGVSSRCGETHVSVRRERLPSRHYVTLRPSSPKRDVR
jgi:hypothetical protein